MEERLQEISKNQIASSITNVSMKKNSHPSFLGYLHSFRGFAIINIVVIHAISFALYAFHNNNFNTKEPIARI